MKYTAVIVILGICACAESPSEISSPESQEPGDHVWKDQTDALKKAEDAERMIQDAAKKRAEQLNQEDPPY